MNSGGLLNNGKSFVGRENDRNLLWAFGSDSIDAIGKFYL
jgi:hypothetical protein